MALTGRIRQYKQDGIMQASVISMYTEIREDNNDLNAFILKAKYDPRA